MVAAPMVCLVVRQTPDAESLCAGMDGIHADIRGVGFYRLYQIDRDGGQSEPDEHREYAEGRIVGLHSPWGIIMMLAEKTGWTYHYILHRVAWVNIRMMLADAPRYAPPQEKTEQATDDDIRRLANMI